ncbi:MAG: hypothetical protein VX130_06850 [Verrucomicrobiota bacterium]|nr:hypothetical protein [Verrucomicrobiota bacterium]
MLANCAKPGLEKSNDFDVDGDNATKKSTQKDKGLSSKLSSVDQSPSLENNIEQNLNDSANGHKSPPNDTTFEDPEISHSTPDQNSGSTDQSDENGSLINIDTQHESDPLGGNKVISSKEANASNIATKDDNLPTPRNSVIEQSISVDSSEVDSGSKNDSELKVLDQVTVETGTKDEMPIPFKEKTEKEVSASIPINEKVIKATSNENSDSSGIHLEDNAVSELGNKSLENVFDLKLDNKNKPHVSSSLQGREIELSGSGRQEIRKNMPEEPNRRISMGAEEENDETFSPGIKKSLFLKPEQNKNFNANSGTDLELSSSSRDISKRGRLVKEDSRIKLIDEASNDLGKPFTSQSTKEIRFRDEMTSSSLSDSESPRNLILRPESDSSEIVGKDTVPRSVSLKTEERNSNELSKPVESSLVLTKSSTKEKGFNRIEAYIKRNPGNLTETNSSNRDFEKLRGWTKAKPTSKDSLGEISRKVEKRKFDKALEWIRDKGRGSTDGKD